MKITVLMEDRAETAGLVSEHGLSFFLEDRGKRMLFDCGQSGAFLENAAALGVDLTRLDAVVLSHGHYDHARGFPALARAGLAGRALYTGPGFFREKWSRTADGYADRAAGFGPSSLGDWGIEHRVVDGALEVFPGVYLVAGFPRVTEYEKVPEKFLLRRSAGFIPDDFGDEVCMAVETDGGLAVLVGCAHPGIVNMVRRVREVLRQPVTAVYGGVHLLEADPFRIKAAITDLQKLGVRELGLCHCSGDGVCRVLEGMPGFRSRRLCVGSKILI